MEEKPDRYEKGNKNVNMAGGVSPEIREAFEKVKQENAELLKKLKEK